MLIRKKPPRSHAPGEPILHDNHPLPVTRRDFVAAGFLSGPAMVIGPAWLGALLTASRADAALSADIQALLALNQCNVPTASGNLPFICFDLAGGANLVGSEVLVGVQGGQTNFLSTAGYGKLGVPGNMVPSSSANIDASLGLLWHADGAIKRGILSKATTPATAAGTNGAVLESQVRISGGNTAQAGAGDTAAFTGTLSMPNGSTPGVQLIGGDPNADAALKNQVRCAYVKAAHTADKFGDPAALDPTRDTNITGGASPIFTASDFSDSDVAKTATVMKLVLNGFAGAGTITLGGYDYHDGTRATGEMRNFKAGQMIGAVLEYAQRLKTPVMIYVFSDGSLTSTGMVDNSVGGRGKLGWQGDNASVASTFFLVYSPTGRPQLRNGTAGQQIGYFSSDGSVVSTSSPAANAVNQLVQVVILNYMGLMGTDGQFPTLFPMQSLGSGSALAGLTAFTRIV